MEGFGFRNISNYRTGMTREELVGTAITLSKANGGHRVSQALSRIYMENQESSEWDELPWPTAAPVAVSTAGFGSAVHTGTHLSFPQSLRVTGTPASVTAAPDGAIGSLEKQRVEKQQQVNASRWVAHTRMQPPVCSQTPCRPLSSVAALPVLQIQENAHKTSSEPSPLRRDRFLDPRKK